MSDDTFAIPDAQAAIDTLVADHFEQKPAPPRTLPPAPIRSNGALTRFKKYAEKCPDAISGQHGHDAMIRLVCEAVRFGLVGAELDEAATWLNTTKCDPQWSARELQHKTAEAFKLVQAEGKVGARLTEPRKPVKPLPARGDTLTGDVPILDPKDPLPAARELVAAEFIAQARRTLHHHRGEFLRWTGTHCAPLDDSELRATVYRYTERAVTITTNKEGEPKQVPFKPTKAKVENILDALAAVANVPTITDPPAWLDAQAGDPDPMQLVATRNCLLHLPTCTSYPHTPRLLNRYAVEFDYDPDAGVPEEWLRFLRQLWADDDEAVRTLQQWFGYCLTTDTRQQKIALLVGPKRSGKGTIARILSALVGRANVAAPTLAGLSQNFGLAPLIGATLAIIADARLSGRADQAVIAERLLSISGEDAITIDRKHRTAWTGKLATRFMILSNELPRLADASGALASRFIVLTLGTSFYGKEDHGLTDRLMAELPGIFNWAVDGWRNLQRAGRFVTPASSIEAVTELEDLGSPIAAFIRERCVVAHGRSVERGRLFEAWKAWCETEGRDHPGDNIAFGRNLRAAQPGLRDSQPRVDGLRLRFYEGIDLRDD